MRVGNGRPTLMSFVFSLKSLQNCPMLMFLYSNTKRYKTHCFQGLATKVQTQTINIIHISHNKQAAHVIYQE